MVIILWGRGNRIAHGITCICPTMSYLGLFFAGDVPLNDKINPVAIDLIVTSAEVKRSPETDKTICEILRNYNLIVLNIRYML